MGQIVGMSSSVIVLMFALVNAVHSIPPHIIFIVADDLGWNDVGWHNNDMLTPNLDKLAASGVILNSSYVQPVCTPSRNCFMTGYYPFHTGLQHNVIFPGTPSYLPPKFTLLPEKLKELNYSTHIVGKWHLGSCNWNYTPTFRGFDSFTGYYNGAEGYFDHTILGGYDYRHNLEVYHPPEGKYSPNIIADHAIQILEEVDPATEPLYLYLPFQSVHSPYEVPQHYEDLYPNVETKSRRTYCGMVSALDEAIGNITAVLDNRGFLENAIVVFTTDNGGPTYQAANNLPLRGSKTTLWEGGTRGVAFVYSRTLLQRTGYVSNEIIHAVDWFPTLLSLAGGHPDPWLDGVNQWKMLSTGAPSARNEFIYNIDEISNNSAIRVGRYKLLQGSPGKYNGWTPLPPLNNHLERYNDSHAMPEYQLYDVIGDPGEHDEISEDFPDVVERLKSRLASHRKSMVPAFFPPNSKLANPKNYGGLWSPGFC